MPERLEDDKTVPVVVPDVVIPSIVQKYRYDFSVNIVRIVLSTLGIYNIKNRRK